MTDLIFLIDTIIICAIIVIAFTPKNKFRELYRRAKLFSNDRFGTKFIILNNKNSFEAQCTLIQAKKKSGKKLQTFVKTDINLQTLKKEPCFYAISASGELIHCDKCKKICRTIDGNDHFEQFCIDDKIMTNCWECI